ncbi:MAG: type II secretion system protein GspN [Spirochaetes bacterium]|nr:type II secretion system protein GspN [Spirochaetota bacterium]
MLAVVCTFIFLLITFPYSTLTRNQLQAIADKIGKSSYIGDISFSLTDSTKIDEFNITLNNGSEINLQFANIDIGLFSALFNKSVKGNTFIQNIKYSQDKTTVNTVLNSDFDLDFESYSQYPSKGNINLVLQNTIANGISIQGFEIPPVRFSSINADLNINKNKVQIDDIIFTGPDLKGRISGSIELAKFFKQSRLNLNIIIDSSSAILENYKILLQSWIDDSKKIQLNINGTVSNPKVNTNKAGKTALKRNDDFESDDKFQEKRPPVMKTDNIDAYEEKMLRQRRDSKVMPPDDFRPSRAEEPIN